MRKKIFISAFEIKDIGGISTSVHNFIHTISPFCDIDLCVLTNYISPNFTFPENVRIVPFTPNFNLTFGDKSRINNMTVEEKIKFICFRFFRKLYGYERTLPVIMNSLKFSTQYDAAIAFWNDIYSSNGTMLSGGDYYQVINNVIAKTKIAWIHNDANQLGFTHDICHRIFQQFDAIVNVSNDCKRIFDAIIPEYASKSFVVYNCYNIEDIKQKSLLEEKSHVYSDNGKLHFVTVCRLNDQQKKVSRIIETCIRLYKENYTNFDWTIVGDGPDKEEYLKTANEVIDADVLRFVGLKSNPYPYMKHADAFILSSLYEGFGMTIREAQITGTPTFSTRFGAAEEAIIEGKQGEICDNSSDGLYCMVKELLTNPCKIKMYSDYLNENPISNEVALQQFFSIFQ